MDANELLSVSPKLLAQAVLHRRERLVELIPGELELKKQELQEAEPLAKSAKKDRDDVNSKVANLKKERDTAQVKARKLFEESNDLREEIIEEGGMKNPDPKWAKDKLSTKLQSIENKLQTSAGNHKTEEKYINEMKALIREHEEWVEERSASQPKVKKMRNSRNEAIRLLEVAQKAHEAMVVLAESNENKHQQYMDWEDLRRKSISRCRKLEDALESSTSAVTFWEDKIQSDNFDSLLTDSKRVSEGGPSSKAIIRANKLSKTSEHKGGEEE